MISTDSVNQFHSQEIRYSGSGSSHLVVLLCFSEELHLSLLVESIRFTEMYIREKGWKKEGGSSNKFTRMVSSLSLNNKTVSNF